MGAGRATTLRKLIIPASLPALMNTLKVAVGLAWIGSRPQNDSYRVPYNYCKHETYNRFHKRYADVVKKRSVGVQACDSRTHAGGGAGYKRVYDF